MSLPHTSRDALTTLARQMLEVGGLVPDKAAIVADLLIQTDALGVNTHGISMVPYYLPELENGNMTSEGSYTVIKDTGATVVWDGNYLPGHWLMQQALELCLPRARQNGLVALTIRRSHHIGCLSTLTRIAADQGLVCMIMTSDPSGRWVAPYGGVEPTFTPNPWAVGYPAATHPVLIDTCASITTVSKVREHVNTGTPFQHPWMLDAQGTASTDANVVNQSPKGTILPVGGMDHGHKGFAMALMVEMMTQGLSGHGRSCAPTRWGGNVYLQVMDPEAFGGSAPFVTEVEHLNAQCRANKPAAGFDRVRIPGDRAEAALQRAEKGITLPDEVWQRVSTCAARLGVALP